MNLDMAVRYNRDIAKIELDEGNRIIPISEDWYMENVYDVQPAESSHVPITKASPASVKKAFNVLIALMDNRIIGSMKLGQMIETINNMAENEKI